MDKIFVYPKCAQSFRNFYSHDKQLVSKFVNKLINVTPFDVSLRDGLQGLSKEEQLKITSSDKIKQYWIIRKKYGPINMEIGSIVSNKVLPIFKDSSNIYNRIERYLFEPDEQKVHKFILIPNEEQFKKINRFIGLSCFSFITSVSESFQIKNTKMSLDTTFQQINNMIKTVKNNPNYHKIKLYISCINECPIEGKINNNIVLQEILKYQELKPDILCLSDTCGTLTEEDFNYIILNLKNHCEINNLSLHLHVRPGREDEVEKIVHTALDFGITSFDVSALNNGGCSVTIEKDKLAPNMSYEQYYKFLTNYLLK